MDKDAEYSLFLGYVNKLTERRQKVTATYLSVNAAIVGGIAFVFKDIQMAEWGRQLAALVLLVAGIIVCDLWRRLIRQYSTSIGWWYTQLRKLEETMTTGSKLIDLEYLELYRTKSKKTPLGLTRYETRLTFIFIGIYGISIAALSVILIFF